MRRATVLVLRALLSGVLLWSGAVKALNPAAFAEAIAGFRLVPWTGTVWLSLYLPWLELFLGAALWLRRFEREAVVVCAVLFSAFTVLWLVTAARGIDVACGCFGGAVGGSALWGAARALALVGCAVFIGKAGEPVCERGRMSPVRAV